MLTFQDFRASGRAVQQLGDIPGCACGDSGDSHRSGRVYDFGLYMSDGRNKNGNLILSSVLGNMEFEGQENCEYALWQFAIEEGLVNITDQNCFRLYRRHGAAVEADWRLDVRGSGCPTVDAVIDEFWHDFHVNNDGELIDYCVMDLRQLTLGPVATIPASEQFARDFSKRTMYTLQVHHVQDGCRTRLLDEYTSEVAKASLQIEVDQIVDEFRLLIETNAGNTPVMHVD